MMKRINTYIVEKFKISKDIKDEIYFKEDEPMLRVAMFDYPQPSVNMGDFRIGGNNNELLYFTEIEDNRIYFHFKNNTYTKRDFYSYENELFLNSNGYCEARGELHSGRTVIALYLHKEEAIKFLKEILPIYGEDKEIINCLKNYFDKEDTITGLFRYSFHQYVISTLLKELQ